MAIPSSISLSERQSFPVVQKSLEHLGHFDRNTGEIAIRKDQPEAGKHVILLHELLHFTAEVLIQGRVIKRQPDEAFIANAAPVLLLMLVRAGLWTGVSYRQLKAFMQKQSVAAARAKKRGKGNKKKGS